MRDPIYTYCREVLPPSSVDQATSLSFTRAGASNLALARGNVLELYKIDLVLKTASSNDTARDEYQYNKNSLGGGEEFDLPMIQERSASANKRPQMHLVGRWSLHGKIMDMQAVRGSKQQGGVENLLLSFAEAKMALVSFDQGTQSIVTESIHYYEHEQLQHKTRNDEVSCALRTDTEGRCVAMRIYDDKLAILPLATGNDEARPYSDSYVVDMRGEAGIRGIRDCVFLAGYLEPTLAILHEPVAMWSGMLDNAVDSLVITVVSLDLVRRSVSTLNTVGRLPYDSRTLVAVPDPIGGVLVVGASSITHVANGTVSCISVLNKAAARGIGIAMVDCIDDSNEALGLVLDPHACACAFVGPKTAALWTQQGFCFLLTMDGDGRLVRRIVAKQVAGSEPSAETRAPVADTWDDVGVVPSCVAELRVSYDDDSGVSQDSLLLFVGGTAGRSILLEVEDRGSSDAIANGDASMDIDADLYGESTAMPASKGNGIKQEASDDRYRFTVYDELLGTGPIVAMEVGARSQASSGNEENLELVTCAGNEWRGRLRVQQRQIQPEIVAAFDVPGAPVRGVWTVRCVAEYNIGGVMQAAADSGSLSSLNDRFMVLSRDASTAVFSVGDELAEMERTGFFTKGPTICVAELLACTRVVQVYASGLRVVNASGRETQSVAVDAGQEIVGAEVSDPLVLLRMSGGDYVVYEAMPESSELRLVSQVPAILGRASHVSLFRDTHRVLVSNRDWTESNRDLHVVSEDLDNDDEFDSLYADAKQQQQQRRKRLTTQVGGKRQVKKKRDDSHVGASLTDGLGGPLYVAVLLLSGDLCILRLPDFEPVWTMRRFDSLPSTLIPSAVDDDEGSEESQGMRLDQVRLAQLGGDSIETLHLVALTTAGELSVYRAFDFKSSGDSMDLALRFTRVAHDVFAYEPEYERRVIRAQARQLAAYAAWTEADKERLEERAVEERLARERAVEKQRREEAAAVADWGEDSDDEVMVEAPKPAPLVVVPPVEEDDLYADADDSRDVFGEDTTEYEKTLLTDAEAAQIVEEEVDEPTSAVEAPVEEEEDPLDLLEPFVRAPKLTILENVGGYAAVFVSGARPALVLVGSKRHARVHPIRLLARVPSTLQPLGTTSADFDAVAAGLLTPWRAVVGVARFHGSGCSHGFVSLGQGGTLTIAGLPASTSSTLRGGMEFDSPWPVRCITVGTAHPGIAALGGVCFHAASGSYAVAAASMARFRIKEPNPDIAARDANAPTGADQPLISEHERLELSTTSVPPAISRYHVDLLSPVTWETVDSHALDANEHIAAMETLTLDAVQTATGCKQFLCLATTFVLGEDVATRGKMYVFDIVDVVPLPGRPQTNRKLRLLYQEEIRGAISALAELRGNLAVSLGSKILIRSFRSNESLESVAFLDCQAWVRSLAGFKNFLLIGDFVNSLWFAGFQEEGPTRLQVLGRDFCNQLPVECADFLVSGSQLELVAADAYGSLHFFIYAPRDAHSLNGQKLLRRGEYNLRSQVTAIRRLVAKPLSGGQQACLVATASGALYVVSMLPEKTFKRLHRINTQLVHGTEPLAGLNPREFRSVPIHQRQYHAPRRTVLDADLLVPLYGHGSLSLQRETAQRDGTTADRVLRDIAEIERTVSFF
ncbi:mRNA cleavage and polyadenylation factor subunit [Coemansia sp. S142-1]|nr:mRNA cleavage and polyadenylation factor subunit [Coemansia sp. S142-1]